MKDINLIAKLPEVLGAVLTDPSGALIDAFGDVDGESAGAVHAYSVRGLSQAGELLGLGSFERASITSAGKACVIATHDEAILGVTIDPSRPLGAFEKKLKDTLRR